MHYWALGLSTGDGVNKQRGLRHRGAGLSPRSTLTDRLKARLKCVGCGDLYWKSFTHLFPQGLCPSTTEAPQTLAAPSQSLLWLFGHIRQQRIFFIFFLNAQKSHSAHHTEDRGAFFPPPGFNKRGLLMYIFIFKNCSNYWQQRAPGNREPYSSYRKPTK